MEHVEFVGRPSMNTAGPILHRYDDVCQALRSQTSARGPNGQLVSPGQVAVPPLDGYATGEIMLGSHIDTNPETVDVVHVWSSRTENGQEHFAIEAFVDYTDRGVLDRIFKKPGQPWLHHYVSEYVRGASGSQLVDVLLATCDPKTGELHEVLRGNDAIKAVWRLEEQTGKRIT